MATSPPQNPISGDPSDASSLAAAALEAPVRVWRSLVARFPPLPDSSSFLAAAAPTSSAATSASARPAVAGAPLSLSLSTPRPRTLLGLDTTGRRSRSISAPRQPYRYGVMPRNTSSRSRSSEPQYHFERLDRLWKN